jgi:thioredoxin 1
MRSYIFALLASGGSALTLHAAASSTARVSGGVSRCAAAQMGLVRQVNTSGLPAQHPPSVLPPPAASPPAPPPARVCLLVPSPRSLVRQVNTAEFEEEIQDCSTPIILDVFAVWCGPCQLMAPQLELVAEKLGDKVRVLKIDADDEPVVASTLRVQGLPTVMFINDMSVVMRAEGALMADELEALADHHLFGGPPPPQITGGESVSQQ